ACFVFSTSYSLQSNGSDSLCILLGTSDGLGQSAQYEAWPLDPVSTGVRIHAAFTDEKFHLILCQTQYYFVPVGGMAREG
ncbi:MAG: hypothetical protein ABIK28_05970, partial [Planctomycetota bacterium]